MVTFTINGQRVQAKKNETILQVARKNGIDIPSICFHEGLESVGACRLCMVEVTRDEWDGWKKTVASCVYPAEEGIIVITDNEDLLSYRREIIELLMARSPKSEWLKEYAKKFGVFGTKYEQKQDGDNCILCSLCTRSCAAMGCSAISIANRGKEKEVLPPLREAPEDCIGCLSCAMICPTKNIQYERYGNVLKIWGKEFELLKCRVCGKPTITREHANYLISKNKLSMDVVSTCEECKRNEVKDTFKRVLEWENI